MAEKQEAHAGESMVGPHGSSDDHGDDHGHDDHGDGVGHGGESLGPIDRMAWAAALLGIALGLVIFVALLLAVA